MTENRYERDIEIDESALDVEWVEHSQRMLAYALQAANARRAMDYAEANLDFIRASIGKDVRENPDAYGLGGTGPSGRSRFTEEAVKNAILTSADYNNANRDFIEKKYEWEVAFGVAKSFEHRKSALENLVRLHGASYFAGPSVTRDLREERSRAANRKVRFTRRTVGTG